MMSIPDAELLRLQRAGELCPACGYYKRGENGACVECFADWPLPEEPRGVPDEGPAQRLRNALMIADAWASPDLSDAETGRAFEAVARLVRHALAQLEGTER